MRRADKIHARGVRRHQFPSKLPAAGGEMDAVDSGRELSRTVDVKAAAVASETGGHFTAIEPGYGTRAGAVDGIQRKSGIGRERARCPSPGLRAESHRSCGRKLLRLRRRLRRIRRTGLRSHPPGKATA